MYIIDVLVTLCDFLFYMIHGHCTYHVCVYYLSEIYHVYVFSCFKFNHVSSILIANTSNIFYKHLICFIVNVYIIDVLFTFCICLPDT